MKKVLRDPIMLAALAASVIFVALVAWYIHCASQEGINLGEHFLRKQADGVYCESADYRITATKTESGATFGYVLGPNAGTASMTLAPEGEWGNPNNAGIEITYDDGTIWRGSLRGNDLYDEEGFPAGIGMSVLFDEDLAAIGEGPGASAYYLMLAYIGWSGPGVEWSMLILPVILFALAGATWLFPEQMTFLGSRWMFREPVSLSDEGLAFKRMGSAAVAALSCILVIVLIAR